MRQQFSEYKHLSDHHIGFHYVPQHTPTNSPPLPGLAHWTDIKVSVLGSRVGWTPARNNERTNKRPAARASTVYNLSLEWHRHFLHWER